jgi:hypothetical protein
VTFDLVYCPRCGYCYPRQDDAHTLPCGHSLLGAVKMRREVVGRYEVVRMKVRDLGDVEVLLMPDGNGGRLVEHRKKKCKKKSLASLDAYLAGAGQRNPVFVAAFRARLDVRRGGRGIS